MDTKTYEKLLSDLESSDFITRWRIASNRALARDVRFIDPLIHILQNDSEYGPRCGAAANLSHFQDEKVRAALLQALIDKDYRVRKIVVRVVVENISYYAKLEMIEPLIAMFGDENRAVAEQVPSSLAEIGEEVTGPVIKVLESDNPQVRYYAVLTLGKIKTEEALKALEKVRDTDKSITAFGWKISDLAKLVLNQ